MTSPLNLGQIKIKSPVRRIGRDRIPDSARTDIKFNLTQIYLETR